MKKLLILTLCLVCVFAVSYMVQADNETETEGSTPAITAEQVLEKSIEATGGHAAYDKIKSTHTKCSMEIVGQSIKFSVETFSKAPDKVLVIQEMSGFGKFVRGYDGKVGWSNDQFNGLRELEKSELVDVKRESQLNSALKWRELYKKVELVGTEKIGERTAYKISLTPEVGKPLLQYYDQDSFLLIRMDITAESPQGTVTMEVYPSDWRDVDGVKIPFLMKMKSPIGEMLMRITELKNNIEIDDSKFAKPADTKKPTETETEEAE